MDLKILQRVAEKLRNHREFMGLTVPQVSKKIKIRKKYLQAIENCDLTNLPSAAYTIGYIKEYFKFFGLESKEYITKLKVAKSGKLKGGASKNLITEKEFIPSFAILLLSLIATILIYMLIMYFRN